MSISQDPWRTFIVEDDFKFISQNGINAVRIPVGWWIASDPTPPQPYVGGSLKALDNAFLWAQYVHLHLYNPRYSLPPKLDAFSFQEKNYLANKLILLQSLG
jgi:hypothetical protein